MPNVNEIIYNHLYDGLTKNGNRSPERTKKLHAGVIELIEQHVPDLYNRYTVKNEYKIKCGYGNKFTIDVALIDKATGELSVCILVKGLISSIAKNRANLANTTNGEIFRITNVAGREKVKIWFITFIANETPVFGKAGKTKHMEKARTAHVDFDAAGETRPNIYHTTIKYDLTNVDYTDKVTFRNTLDKNNITNITIDSLNQKANLIFG